MRFAVPACKFGGLHLCHQFFYDLMILLKTVSLNVAKEWTVKNCEKDMQSLYSLVTRTALQNVSETNVGSDSVKGSSH